MLKSPWFNEKDVGTQEEKIQQYGDCEFISEDDKIDLEEEDYECIDIGIYENCEA